MVRAICTVIYFSYRRHKWFGGEYHTPYSQKEEWKDSEYNSCIGTISMNDKEGRGYASVVIATDTDTEMEEIFENFVREIRKNNSLPRIKITGITIR